MIIVASAFRDRPALGERALIAFGWTKRRPGYWLTRARLPAPPHLHRKLKSAYQNFAHGLFRNKYLYLLEADVVRDPTTKQFARVRVRQQAMSYQYHVLPSSTTTSLTLHASNETRKVNDGKGDDAAFLSEDLATALSSLDDENDSSFQDDNKNTPVKSPCVEKLNPFFEDSLAIEDATKERLPKSDELPQVARQHSRLGQRCLRFLLMDVPLFVTFTIYVSTFVLERISNELILPQMELHRWNATDEAEKYTYFRRECNVSDITATDPSELVFNDTMSPEDALQLFNTHGSIMFPNVISPETAAEFRQFILEENLKNDNYVSIFNAEHRWCFEIEIDHHPIVAQAAKEMLSNQRMVAAIEAIVGKNPAVTEFLAITTAPGAVTQIFHTDSGPGATRYSRSFFPSFSFFTPLQNTTRAMGATDICPGTQMCSDNQVMDCYEHGISTAGKDDNWPVGWTALTSQQTFHRGTAHTDLDSPHRVMFFFTFAPRPRFGHAQAETRSFARGGTYGTHWKQWGLTLRDYAEPEKYMMSLPRALLRTWGMHKPRSTQWGWDFLTIMACSIPTEEVGSFDIDNFEKMMKLGGLPLLPRLLQPNLDIDDYEDETGEDLWVDFFRQTLQLCRSAAMSLYAFVLALYITSATCLLFMQPQYRLTAAIRWIRWTCLLHGLVLLLSWQFFIRAWNTSWARNIKAARSFQLSRSGHIAPDLPGTNPTINDILTFDDMRSDYLASLSTVLDTFQPGNKEFGDIIGVYSSSFAHLTLSLQEELCSSILRWNRQQGRRVLVKNKNFNWAVAERWRALRFCHKEMMKHSNPFRRELIMQLDSLIAETKFGHWRESHMHQKHIPLFLVKLQDSLMNWLPYDHQNGLNSRARLFSRFPTLRKLTKELKPQRHAFKGVSGKFVLSDEPELGPPSPEAWLEEGDEVEVCEGSTMAGKSYRVQLSASAIAIDQLCLAEDTDSAELLPLRIISAWYHARIIGVNGDKLSYTVKYDDGTVETELCRYCVRHFHPYKVGEIVDLKTPDHWFVQSKILMAYPVENQYDVVVLDEEGGEFEVMSHVPASLIRRIEYGVLDVAVGSQVLARPEKEPEYHWCKASIQDFDEDTGTYTVIYQEDEVEGKIEHFVEPQRLRKYMWAK